MEQYYPRDDRFRGIGIGLKINCGYDEYLQLLSNYLYNATLQ